MMTTALFMFLQGQFKPQTSFCWVFGKLLEGWFERHGVSAQDLKAHP